jgi:hypothetical protein
MTCFEAKCEDIKARSRREISDNSRKDLFLFNNPKVSKKESQKPFCSLSAQKNA